MNILLVKSVRTLTHWDRILNRRILWYVKLSQDCSSGDSSSQRFPLEPTQEIFQKTQLFSKGFHLRWSKGFMWNAHKSNNKNYIIFKGFHLEPTDGILERSLLFCKWLIETLVSQGSRPLRMNPFGIQLLRFSVLKGLLYLVALLQLHFSKFFLHPK